MKYVGVDHHKQVISLCVVVQSNVGRREVVARRRLACHDTGGIAEFFRGLDPFQAVVEATASYEWFVELIEPWATRGVSAHPTDRRAGGRVRPPTPRLPPHLSDAGIVLFRPIRASCSVRCLRTRPVGPD